MSTRTNRTKTETMIARVRQHAEANAGNPNWAFLLECLTDADIEDIIGSASSSPWAIMAVDKWLRESNVQPKGLQHQ